MRNNSMTLQKADDLFGTAEPETKLKQQPETYEAFW